MSCWPKKQLAELLEIQNGYAFDSKRFSPTGDTPLIRIRDLKNGMSTETSYSGDYEKKYVVHADDLLIGMDGEFACYKWHGPAALLNQRVCRLQHFSNLLYADFLFYGINRYLKEIESHTTFATVKHLSSKTIQGIAFPLPPIAEQKRIVAILDEAFAGIGTAVANAEKNFANARELFESHLNAVFAQKGKGWVEKTLREVASEFGRGKSKHRPRNATALYGGPYPFIQTGDVRNSFHLINSFSQTYSEVGLAQSKLWPKGTICITIAANIAETGILGFDACFPDSVIGIVVDERLTTNDFVEYLLQSVKARIKARGKGSAQDNINLATFESERFSFPSLEHQKRIISSLHALSSETKRLESIYQQKLDSLSELKQSILRKAFAGELTTDPDKVLAEVAS